MVGEKRYFECAAKHGLFAPLHKVTRSPKNRMMRERSSLTPGKLRRYAYVYKHVTKDKC